jgi:hypothetical protein
MGEAPRREATPKRREPRGRAETAAFTKPSVVVFCDAIALIRRVCLDIGAFPQDE